MRCSARSVRRTLTALGAALAVMGALLAVPATSAAAARVCGLSAGAQLCLSVSAGSLRGEQTVSATWDGGGVYTIEFTLDGKYLNFEYEDPYTFVWPTQKELDGGHLLAARVHAVDTYGDYVQTSVRLANGNVSSIPRSSGDYAQLFQPQPGPTIFAATGNGGAEKYAEIKLLNYIESSRPKSFFYLGEVHEFGTWATRRDHYGLASFDDPAGAGTLWGRMAGYTLATAGNHERDYITEFEDYWHQRPLWSTVVVGGVRIYDLTSECNRNGGCGIGGAQYAWLKDQVAKHTESCVISLWHRPVVSLDAARSGDNMNAAWALLAQHGGDLALSADTRDMSEVRPMNAALQTGQPDSHMVQLISGAAAARWVQSPSNNDPRVAWRLYKTPGAVFVTPANNKLSWQFKSNTGVSLRSGQVSC